MCVQEAIFTNVQFVCANDAYTKWLLLQLYLDVSIFARAWLQEKLKITAWLWGSCGSGALWFGEHGRRFKCAVWLGKPKTRRSCALWLGNPLKLYLMVRGIGKPELGGPRSCALWLVEPGSWFKSAVWLGKLEIRRSCALELGNCALWLGESILF